MQRQPVIKRLLSRHEWCVSEWHWARLRCVREREIELPQSASTIQKATMLCPNTYRKPRPKDEMSANLVADTKYVQHIYIPNTGALYTCDVYIQQNIGSQRTLPCPEVKELVLGQWLLTASACITQCSVPSFSPCYTLRSVVSYCVRSPSTTRAVVVNASFACCHLVFVVRSIVVECVCVLLRLHAGPQLTLHRKTLSKVPESTISS